MMIKKFFILIIIASLASCGGNPTPGPARPGNTPAAAPTQQLTPPGLPASGFPLLDTPLEGQIVYSNGDGDIYVIEPRPGAKAKKVLTAPNDKGFLQEPSWSPDGQRIAYAYLLPFDVSGLPSADLLVANADGSNPQSLLIHQLNGEIYAMPVYSDDGRYLYYSHTTPIYKDKQIVDATLKLERLDLQSKQAKEIANNAQQPAVSPDGKRIAYIVTDPNTFQRDLMIADLEGQGATVVVPGNSMSGGVLSPNWSRDSKRIMFAAPNFFAKNNQPTNQPTNPIFSWLVGWFDVRVAEAHGPPWDFWIVDADGKNLQRLTEIGEDEPYAVFSPDGKHIAFIGLAGLYILDANGKNVRWLHREGGHGRVDWKK